MAENLETFSYTLSGDWSDFVEFCQTPIKVSKDNKKGGR